jgi:hypothetical protein
MGRGAGLAIELVPLSASSQGLENNACPTSRKHHIRGMVKDVLVMPAVNLEP